MVLATEHQHNQPCCCDPLPAPADLYSGIEDDYYSGWSLDAKGLQSLINACPALTALTLSSVLQPGDAEPLLGLPASCVNLEVGGRAFDNSTVSVISR
jgi:hypothetical protein